MYSVLIIIALWLIIVSIRYTKNAFNLRDILFRNHKFYTLSHTSFTICKSENNPTYPDNVWNRTLSFSNIFDFDKWLKLLFFLSISDIIRSLSRFLSYAMGMHSIQQSNLRIAILFPSFDLARDFLLAISLPHSVYMKSHSAHSFAGGYIDWYARKRTIW